MEPLFGLHSDISPKLLAFLNDHFKTCQDLSSTPSLLTKLKIECGDLDRDLLSLQSKLTFFITSWVSSSHDINSILCHVKVKSKSLDGYQIPGEMGEVVSKRIQMLLGVELPLLAKEVRRIEEVRVYSETTLQLEALVGDLEDALFVFLNQGAMKFFPLHFSNLSNSTVRLDLKLKQQKLLLTLEAVKNIEEVVLGVTKSHPEWKLLLKAVDARVDKTLAVLRPEALADHRALLSSLGWPPPLSSSNGCKETGSEIPNPLLLMQGDTMERYSQSFLSLCALQHLQTSRQMRQNNLSSHKEGFDRSLWTIDELVSPIASRIDHHFLKWSEQPKFIFTLVHKITRDFIEGVEEILQPLIDKARLVGYSAKEAWVSALVKMLCRYLRKHTFPGLAENYYNWNGHSYVIATWLHLVDLIIAFDKQMQALASTGNSLFPVDELSRGISVLSIFCDQLDWLQIWAEIELKDSEEKLKTELYNERLWMVDIKLAEKIALDSGTELFLLTTREDYKAPSISGSVVGIAWATMERCKALPSILRRVQFIRSSATKFLQYFFELLLWRCQDTELSSAYVDDNYLLRIASAINAAGYCEFVLRGWSEDINFLEMRIAEVEARNEIINDPSIHPCFFEAEIHYLTKLETDWVEEIMAALLRQFSTLSCYYVQDLNQWQGGSISNEVICSDDFNISLNFIEPLDTLKDKLRILKMGLNSKDFLDLWRSIAGGIDHFIFSTVILNGLKFSKRGIALLETDMGALFSVFQPFCARPASFFPFVSESLKLFRMHLKDVKHFQSILSRDGKEVECLQLHGLCHIYPAQAEKILKSMVF